MALEAVAQIRTFSPMHRQYIEAVLNEIINHL